MNRSAAEVLEDVRRLPPGEFDWLLGELLQAGDGSIAAEIDAAWKTEVERRVAEIDSGAVKMLPIEDVLARMDARILARQRGVNLYRFTPKPRLKLTKRLNGIGHGVSQPRWPSTPN